MKRKFLTLLPLVGVLLSGCAVNFKSLLHIHKYGEYQYDSESHWKECKDCGAIYKKRNHVFGDFQIEKEPTETEDGLKYRLCKTCEYRDEEVLRAYGSKDKLKYVLNEETNEYSVYAVDYNVDGEVIIPSYYSNKLVTEIQDYAFAGCAFLTKVTIPNTIKTIGKSAFVGCARLESVDLPTSVKTIKSAAFNGCASIKTVKVHETVTGFGDNVFRNCLSLKSAEILGDFDKLSDFTFCNCRSLDSIKLGEKITKIGKQAFYNTGFTYLQIPDQITTIDTEAFGSCNSLMYVSIGSGLTEIATDVFGLSNKIYTIENNSSIDFSSSKHGASPVYEIITKGQDRVYPNYDGSVVIQNGEEIELIKAPYNNEIPTNVTIIRNTAFKDAKYIQKIVIPDSVKRIEYGTFSGFESLYSVTLGTGLVAIGGNTFKDCFKLVEVINKSSLELEIGSDENGAVAKYALDIKNGSYVSKVAIENGFATYIHEGQTYLIDCLNTGDVVLPTYATVINSYAFYMTNIDTLKIPESYTTIKQYAFSNTYNLYQIELSNGLTTIENHAFLLCYKLVSIINKSNIHIEKTGNNQGNIASNSQEIVSSKSYSRLEDKNGFIIYDSKELYAYKGREKEIEIPKGVTKLHTCALFGNKVVEKVTISSSITEIPIRAFEGCSNLKTVVLPNNLRTLQSTAFKDCTSLLSVNIPNAENVFSRAFEGCTSLVAIVADYKYVSLSNEYGGSDYVSSIITEKNSKSLSVSNSYLSSSPKAKNDSISHISVGESTTSVYLPGATLISDVKLPKSIENVTLSSMPLLKEVELPKGTKSVTLSESAITKLNLPSSLTSMTCTRCYDLKEVTFEEGIETISANAFSYCYGLESIVLPDSITTIGNKAFEVCNKLASLSIGNKVTSIGEYAFRPCAKLDNIDFRGTQAEWNAISVQENTLPTNLKTITCTDGVIEK